MRFKAVNLRLALTSLLAVLALGAVTASAAQAATAEGPFYKITGKRLASGESKVVTAKVKSGANVRFVDEAGNGSIECKKVGLAAASKLLGSTGANFGSGDVTLEFSECLETGSAPPKAGCQLEGEAFKTEPLTTELTYTGSGRTGGLAVMLQPVKKGTAWAKLKYNKEGACRNEEGELDGYGLAGDLLSSSKEAPLEVGKEPAAAKVLDIGFPSSLIRHVWSEQSGALTELETGLENGKGAWTVTGTLELEAGGAEWGVFT